MLEHAAEQRELFAALMGRKGGQLLQELVHDIWADLIRAGWPEADELHVQAVAGAFGSTITWWLVREPTLLPAEVDRRFRALIESGVS